MKAVTLKRSFPVFILCFSLRRSTAPFQNELKSAPTNLKAVFTVNQLRRPTTLRANF
jgi:hypothetical protein